MLLGTSYVNYISCPLTYFIKEYLERRVREEVLFTYLPLVNYTQKNEVLLLEFKNVIAANFSLMI